MLPDTDVEADYTLATLWEEGISALQNETPTPGTTYEMAPGIVGTMPYPSLAVREEVNKLSEDALGLFREDATAEDFRLRRLQSQLQSGQAEDEDEVRQEIEELKEGGAQNPVAEDITPAEWTQRTAETNCRQTVAILEFEQEVEVSDVNPEMAAVVSAHFGRLVPGTLNGQTQS